MAQSKRRRRKGVAPRKRSGLLPNEYRRHSLVRVERLAEPGDGRGSMARAGASLTAWDNYIVETHRLDSEWTAWVEINGVTAKLPGKVVDQLIRHRDSVITEARSTQARARALEAAQRAASEEEALQAEMARDLA